MAQHMNASVNVNPKLDLSDRMNRYMCDRDVEENPFTMMSIDSKYYDVDDMIPQHVFNTAFQYKTLHLNIQGLNAKFDDFKTLLSQMNDKGIHLDIIMLCETFLNDDNANLFHLPGYSFIYQNR
jgi:hypothetical protein